MDALIVSVESIQTKKQSTNGLNSSTHQSSDLSCSKSSCSSCVSSYHLIDESKRNFLITTSCVLAGIGSFGALFPLFSSLMPNHKTEGSAKPLAVDLSLLAAGEMLTVEWDGKPIFILRRTQKMLSDLKLIEQNLRDPESRVEQQPIYAKNIYRAIDPEYVVLIGLCTHLGCIPQYLPQKESFFCPCHGSSFDLAGRVFKNVPAPINLAVPPYYFKHKNLLIIGEHAS